MATVRFIRKDGHPAIEVKAIEGSEAAYMAEFMDSIRDQRYQAKPYFEYDGSRKLVFQFKSRIKTGTNSYISTHYKSIENHDFDLAAAGYDSIFKLISGEAAKSLVKSYRLNGAIIRYLTDNMLSNCTRAVIVLKDTRLAYPLWQDLTSGEISKFALHNDMTMEKLFALEKQLGLY